MMYDIDSTQKLKELIKARDDYERLEAVETAFCKELNFKVRQSNVPSNIRLKSYHLCTNYILLRKDNDQYSANAIAQLVVLNILHVY